MFHYFGTLTNQRGDALPNWQVEVVDVSSGATVNIFSDENSTPITGNKATTDTAGNYDFFVVSGTYSLKFYDDAGTYQRTQRYMPMYGADNATAAADSADDAAASAAAALTSESNAAASATAAASSATAATTNGAAQVTLAAAQATAAAASAAAAAASVAATRQSFGVEAYNGGSAITQGIYNGDYNAAANYTINRFTAIIEDATVGATAQISVIVDGVPTYGPVTVTFGTELATTPSFSIPSGADDAYLVENMTGTVRKIYIRADGVPA